MPQGVQNLLIARPDAVVCFYESPAHPAIPVDDVSGRVRPTWTTRVEDTVAINDPVLAVLEQGKIEFPGIIIRQLPNKAFGILRRVNTDRKDLQFFLFLDR